MITSRTLRGKLFLYDTVNLILQWPMQFQKPFVSLLHPLPGAESIVTRVWQCTSYQKAKDSCWVQCCRLWQLGTSSNWSGCNLSTPDRQMVAQQPETKSSLTDSSFWRSDCWYLQLATEKKHCLGREPWKTKLNTSCTKVSTKSATFSPL